jgi:hypothetical protein
VVYIATIKTNSLRGARTRRFITALTTARHRSLSWTSRIQSTPPKPISLRYVLIPSSHLRLGLPSGLFPSDFPTMLSGSTVTAAWRVLGLRIEETASRYGGYLRIYWISSRRQPTVGGPPAWRLGGGLTTFPVKLNICYESLRPASEHSYYWTLHN